MTLRWLQGKAGLCDEAVEQIGAVVHLLQPGASQCREFVSGARGQVPQGVPQIPPHSLGRIQLRRVSGEAKDRQSLLSFGQQPAHLCVLALGGVVPHEYHLLTQLLVGGIEQGSEVPLPRAWASSGGGRLVGP